jgi:hypothetical protein
MDEMVSIILKQPVRLILQHHLNSLHIYSFICRFNVNRETAMKAAKAYEQIIHPLLYF